MRAVQELWATWWRYVGWHGIRFGTWHALFAGRSIVPAGQTTPPFWRVNLPGRQVVFSGYHMSPDNLTAYLGELRRRRLPWYHGYPSLLTLLAGHVLDSGFDLGYEVEAITTCSETLMPHQKTLIERAFGVKPRQHYALTEGTANMSECERGMLHVDEDFAAVEFLRLPGEDACRIVGTNFSNFATPLVRYDSHDLAVLPVSNGCGCGRTGRVVERVDGRQEDYVVLRDGTRIGRMDHLFKDMVNIREAQIHQSRPGEITIRVVRREGYGRADEEGLLREAERRIGDGASVAIEYVRELPRSPAGKLRLVVSDVPGASIYAAAARDGTGT